MDIRPTPEIPTSHMAAPVSVGAPARRSTGDGHPSEQPVLIISCDTCVMRDTDTCGDCMMSVLCDVPQGGAVILDMNELREVRMLAAAGLVPTLRHRAVG